MKLSEILEVSLSGGETDSLGVTRILINDKYLIHLRSSTDEEHFYLYAKVGNLPARDGREEICEKLLEANLFGEGTGNSMFALHRQTNTIILMKIFDSSSTSLESYTQQLQQFISYLREWKEKFSDLAAKAGMEISSSEDDILTIMSQRKQKILFI